MISQGTSTLKINLLRCHALFTTPDPSKTLFHPLLSPIRNKAAVKAESVYVIAILFSCLFFPMQTPLLSRMLPFLIFMIVAR